MVSRIKNYLFRKKFPSLCNYTDEYCNYFNSLFARAANINGFNYICTILRVEGITSGHWDSFVEAREAAEDLSNLLRSIGKKGAKKRELRLALFLYCHSTEMSAPYEIIANLLRCCQDKPYMMYPFADLVKVDKKKGLFGKRYLPYPIGKVNYIKKLADICGDEKIGKIFDGFFRNDVRNAFYHSDYSISDDEFRIIQGGEIGKQVISLKELSEILNKCFAFYSAFFIVYDNIVKNLAKGKKFHRWPNYEVLELLSDKYGLTGFKVHFPNKSYAMFERKKYEGTVGMNMMCEKEGISLNVGDWDTYKKAEDWFVDGRPFEEYGTRYNNYGYWKPIVFRGNSDLIQTKVNNITKNETAQGCLFYIYTTGHKAIEFLIKSKKSLFEGNDYSIAKFGNKKRIVIKKCDCNDALFLYDGSIFLETKELNEVCDAIDEVNSLIGSFKNKDAELAYRLKYSINMDIPREKTESQFSISFNMDDPRVTLVTTSLDFLPKSDWKIKSEWI